eukprot:TRINITY_DN4646_c0_g1_i4.p1 TRINITY_DN4646_c0_g1~~TRINITY_DN4646_c0_g1_i4.p1  ORF type:complete len:925 (-),score=199.35 TRINITY_DN4646_c0_g1_i4:717-3491(-)
MEMKQPEMDVGSLMMSAKGRGGPFQQEDEELELLLGEIPQVTSAPPLPQAQSKSEVDSNANSGTSGTFYVVSANNLYSGGSPKMLLDGKNSPRLLIDQRSPLKGPLVEDHNGHNNPGVSSPVRNVFTESVAKNQNELLDDQSLAAAFANLQMDAGNGANEGTSHITLIESGDKMLESQIPAINYPPFDVKDSSLNAHLNINNDTFSPSSRTVPYGMKECTQLNPLSEDNHSVGTGLPALTESQAMNKYLKQHHAFKENAYRAEAPEMMVKNPSTALPQYQQQSFMLPPMTSHASGFHGYHVLPNTSISNGEIQSPNNAIQHPNYLDRSVASFSQPRPCLPEFYRQPARMQLNWQQLEEERRFRMQQQQYMLLQHNHGQALSGLHHQAATALSADSSNRILAPGLYSSVPNMVHPNTSFGNSLVQGAAFSDRDWPTQTQLPDLVVSQNHLDYSMSNGSTCRYFAQGFCSRGQNCPFLHGPVQRTINGRTSNPASMSYKDPSATRIADFEEKTGFPEKILTRNRSRGVSYITTLNPSPTGSRKESLSNSGIGSGLSLANGPSLSGAFQLDIHGQARSISPDVVDADIPFRSLTNTSQQPKYSSLDEVQGRIYFVARDQHGCRFLQRKFDEGSAEDIKKIFVEIIDHIIQLMTDPFGNYLVQKLLEVCNEDQKMQILYAVTRKPSELVNISLNMHGTRAVQKLIEILQTPREVSMVISSLKSGVVTLIKDLNGNHVVQRCLQRLSSEDNKFLFDAAVEHCIEIATHRHGCCVLQRCIDHSSGAERQRLVAEIAANALDLSQDAFGNYVVQYILDLDEMQWVRKDVMNQLQGNYASLSMQKFSSNVVEKCLKIASDEERANIVHELITSTHLGQLLQDPYANYVVQCALSVCKGSLHSTLVDAIRPHLPALRSSPFGKRILSRTNLKK